jgi:hypothetical protein
VTDAAPSARRRGDRDRALLAVGLFIFIWSLTTHGKYSNTGDEPSYLMITRSLVRDHDLDLSNNYAAADSLTPIAHAHRALDGTLQSDHDIGLPLLLTPVYWAAEHLAAAVSDDTLRRVRMTRDLVEYSVISLTLLALVCLAITWLAAGLAYVVPHGYALAIAALFALSPPILTESFVVFPETIALVVMCGVVWWLLAPAPRAWTTWALAAALGYLPWCHRKFSPLVIACVAVMLWQRRDLTRQWSPTARAGLSCLVLMPFAAFYWWSWRTWGTIGGPQMLDRVRLHVTSIPHGFTGILIDRQYGLVADAPIYLAVFAYWALSGRSRRPWLWIVASLVLPMSAYEDWAGGFSPLARYVVPILPFCAVALADSLRAPVMRATVGVLAAAQTVFTAFAWHHPRSLWPWIDGWNPLLRDVGPAGRLYAWALPMVDHSHATHTVAALTTLFLANAVLVWFGRHSLAAGRPRNGAGIRRS